MKETAIDFSLIIPLHNEEAVLPELIKRIEQSAAGWGTYEVILINDGSTDNTLELLRDANKKNPNIKAIDLSRNFGHQAAITAGLEAASGNAVGLMDGDLQDPPELMEQMLAKLTGDTEIVYAMRRTRQEFFVKRFLYKMYYRLLRSLTEIDVPLDAGDFCVMNRHVVDVINSMPERNRFYRGLRPWTGFTMDSVPYDRDARYAGETKYPLLRLIKFGFNGIMAFSTRPLKVAVYIGTSIAFLSFVIGVVLVILKLTVGFNVTGWASTMLAVFFMGGVQLLIMGVIGEYIGTIYMETQHRPAYLTREKIGL